MNAADSSRSRNATGCPASAITAAAAPPCASADADICPTSRCSVPTMQSMMMAVGSSDVGPTRSHLRFARRHRNRVKRVCAVRQLRTPTAHGAGGRWRRTPACLTYVEYRSAGAMVSTELGLGLVSSHVYLPDVRRHVDGNQTYPHQQR